MQALDINLVRRRRIGSALGLLLLAGGMAAAAAAAADYFDASEALEQAQQRLARLQRTQKSANVTRPGDKPATAAHEEDRGAARMTAQLQRPWDEWLREIEQLADPAVALLSVDIEAQGRTLRITGEAKAIADAVAFTERLRQSPRVEAAFLSRHEQRQAGAVRLIRFTLDATWKAAPA